MKRINTPPVSFIIAAGLLVTAVVEAQLIEEKPGLLLLQGLVAIAENDGEQALILLCHGWWWIEAPANSFSSKRLVN